MIDRKHLPHLNKIAQAILSDPDGVFKNVVWDKPEWEDWMGEVFLQSIEIYTQMIDALKEKK